MQQARQYYRLTKPGIVYGNLFHAIVGVLLAYRFGLNWWNVVGLIIGITAVIASACVANNILDRAIDARMARTRKRSLVTRDISVSAAVLFALILLTVGAIVLARMTNLLTLVLTLIAYAWYVWIYGWAKRRTWLSTLIGAVPGALPVMAGYAAISGQLDITSWVLFGMLVAWQMPHFYAIAIYRKQEYQAAKLPVVSIVLSEDAVFRQTLGFGALYSLTVVVLVAIGAIHWLPGSVLVLWSLYWLKTIAEGAQTQSDRWARRVFRQSLLLTIVMMAVSVATLFLQ